MTTKTSDSLWRSLPLVLVWRICIVLVIYTLCRGLFAWYNADLLQLDGWATIARIFRGGLVFDLSGVLYVNLLVIVLHVLPIPWKYHPRYIRTLDIIYWLCNIPALACNLADIVYYRFTGRRTGLEVLDEFSNENPSHFLGFFVDYYPITLSGITLIALWVLLYRLMRPSTKPKLSTKAYYAYSILAFLLWGVFTVGGLRGGYFRKSRPIAPNNASIYVDKPQQQPMVLNTPFVIIRTGDKQHLSEYDYGDDIKSLYSAELREPEASPYSGAFRGRNVVVIIWESLASEWTGELNRDIAGYTGFTPFLDSLMRESYLFERAYASGLKSIDAMPAIFASVARPIVPFVSSVYSGNALNGLPEMLRRKGYDTRFYHNAPNGSMGFDAMAHQLGFASYRGKNEFNNDDEYDGAWGIWDEPFLQYVAEDISTMREPFLASEFTTTSHSPYRIPERYHDRFPQGTNPQHRCMRYTDYALEQFFRTARTKPWYNNTLFIIVADHSVPGELEAYKNANGAFRIPIIFHDPQGKLRGRDTETVVQQADFLPTLADLLGLDEAMITFGNNMFREGGEHFAVHHINDVYQMVRGDYAMQFDGERVIALYNAKLDPRFERDIKDEAPEVIAEMLPFFKAYLQEFSHRMRGNLLRAK